jgi:hypothetical protein
MMWDGPRGGATVTDYQIQASTRRCAASGRELRPGERYFSVLIDEGTRFTRQDYSAEAWQGPPSRTFSFWQGRLPPAGAPRRPPIDEELLADCFARLEDETEPDKLAFRYVLALLLVRKKRMRLEDARREGGQEIMTLRDTRSRARYQVIDPNLPDEELEGVQDEVFRVLGWA